MGEDMFFSQINPWIRYARYLHLDKNSCYHEVVPLDARLFYTLSGQGKIKVKNKEYEMLPHSLLIINSGIPYEIIAPEATVSYAAINFDYTQNGTHLVLPISPVSTENFKSEMLVDFNVIEDAQELSEILYINKIDAIQNKLNTIINEYTQKLLYYESKSGHILAECISESLRFIYIGSSHLKIEPSNRILAYIHSNYHENITNISIGKKFGYHPNYVGFLIKHATGMPVHQYIIHVRLLNATYLLENSSLSISEIATACGFCDSAYFSGCFKKQFGLSPSKYKNV